MCLVDAYLPVGDLVYLAGVIVAGAIVLMAADEIAEQPIYDAASEGVSSPPSPSQNDDDDDDYYNDESNFGGKEPIGKSKGKTPRNNKAQNKQFNDATRGLSPQKKRIIHDLITGRELGFDDIEGIANEFR